jgi:hypothetical protein
MRQIFLSFLLAVLLASRAWAVPVTLVTPSQQEARGVHFGKRFDGQCYARALEYFLMHPDVGGRLVHGRVSFDGGKSFIPHAWVVLPSNKVFESVLQIFVDKADYYEKLRVVEERSYTHDGAQDSFRRGGL